jgi:hypothetical protein
MDAGARQSSISGDEGCTNEMHLFVTRGDSSQRYHQRALTLEPFGIRKLLHCLGPPSEGNKIWSNMSVHVCITHFNSD